MRGLALFLLLSSSLIIAITARREFWNPRASECDLCSPGYGLIYLCNATHSTSCEPCQEGEFSSNKEHLSPCRPCAECGTGLYARHQCTDTRDTRCGSCVSPNAIKNLDFYTKCSTRQLAEEKFEEEIEANEEKWSNGIDADEEHKNWNFMDTTKKSVHHRRSSISGWGMRCWLLVVMLGAGIACLIMLIIRVCSLKRDPGFSYAHMPEEQMEAVNQCAHDLTRMAEKNGKQSVNVKENPMEKWMQV